MKKHLLLLLCSAFAFISITAQPKREFRATWLTTVWSIDWPKTSGSTNQQAELKTILGVLKGANCNAACFQVRSMCDAMYNSAYEPWSEFLSGTRGTAPDGSFDFLKYAIEEAHSRGM